MPLHANARRLIRASHRWRPAPRRAACRWRQSPRPARASSASDATRVPSQAVVLWAFAAFGRYPINDLVRIHDVARLAVHTVRRVDVQFLRAIARVHHLVDSGRTESRARIAVLDPASRAADVRIMDDE